MPALSPEKLGSLVPIPKLGFQVVEPGVDQPFFLFQKSTGATKWYQFNEMNDERCIPCIKSEASKRGSGSCWSVYGSDKCKHCLFSTRCISSSALLGATIGLIDNLWIRLGPSEEKRFWAMIAEQARFEEFAFRIREEVEFTPGIKSFWEKIPSVPDEYRGIVERAFPDLKLSTGDELKKETSQPPSSFSAGDTREVIEIESDNTSPDPKGSEDTDECGLAASRGESSGSAGPSRSSEKRPHSEDPAPERKKRKVVEDPFAVAQGGDRPVPSTVSTQPRRRSADPESWTMTLDVISPGHPDLPSQSAKRSVPSRSAEKTPVAQSTDHSLPKDFSDWITEGSQIWELKTNEILFLKEWIRTLENENLVLRSQLRLERCKE